MTSTEVAEQPATAAKKTVYCCGFMFEGDQVALIRKQHPEWQRGRMNGIGGKVEAGESPLSAMVREFQEEAGYWTSFSQWWNFAVLEGSNYVVHFFSTRGRLSDIRTTTDEEIVVVPVSEITTENAIPNLTWLVPMAKWASGQTLHITENY